MEKMMPSAVRAKSARVGVRASLIGTKVTATCKTRQHDRCEE
jgi:hypothetical protein